MRWATVIVAAALGLLVAWVTLRDWRPVDARRVAAQSAAARLNGTVLDRRGADTWRIRIAGPAGARCVDVNLARFAFDPGRGYRGLRVISCRR